MNRLLVLSGWLLATSAFAQTPPASPSPAELALGTDIAAKVLPDGTYQRIMGGTMSKMMEGMADQMTAMPLAPFLKSAGLPPSDTSKLGRATIRQIMDIVDPAYRQRMQAIMPVMMTEMGKVMTPFEPQMREGLARAYATHFTALQLSDIDRFLNTPSGRAFASQNMTISSDPAVMQKMQAFMPTLIQSIPGIMQKAIAATAGLPKPKTPQMLTDDDRAKLAQLLGSSADNLKTAPAAVPVSVRDRKTYPDMKPRPIEDIARLFGPDHYPAEAMRAGSQGRVVAEVGVDPGGKVVSCTIETSSGSGILDSTTCDIATHSILFDPATDHRARPVAGVYRLPVRWVLPVDRPIVPGDVSAAAPAAH